MNVDDGKNEDEQERLQFPSPRFKCYLGITMNRIRTHFLVCPNMYIFPSPNPAVQITPVASSRNQYFTSISHHAPANLSAKVEFDPKISVVNVN